MATFTDLPAELRNEIYDHCMFPEHDYVYVWATTGQEVVRTVLRSNIFRLSRQIRTEAVVRLFRTKRFVIMRSESLVFFLGWASWYAQNHITHLVVSIPLRAEAGSLAPYDEFFRTIRYMRVLKSLIFKIRTPLPTREESRKDPFRVERTGEVFRLFRKWRGFAMLKEDCSYECEVTFEEFLREPEPIYPHRAGFFHQ
ncbi:hypothetical protein P280DRAFT_229673 [Massarina eburnea CBS 473.64]|uniref:F-box domain-containing protein n=1 Tax=Massarina eburnea CBS 473.64 TaxID=1395130 RepID=A0A6A6SBW3_9PLEO|nr:hypothetical protein P280DRAFT_229673 [Massarina eburnea CBS 473.64]